ncbi:transporter substrate-binding domain-containing protein [Gayadomonas joobiniege]|uniref:transporter substrate-binding domain-containing protein n=1 Tax=Gayadomonas joobiniege TaxID=1234606 RepID=UPI000380D638|nr:transporter substrate-binding domain-containing protein [Gayadomonas joobiniege]
MKYLSAILLVLIFISGSIQAKNINIKHTLADVPKEKYQLGLLKLALSYDTENTYNFQSSATAFTQSKLESALESKQLDVIWLGSNKEYEKRFRAIRVPLYKGLLGHRVFIIKQGQQAKFDTINSLDALKQLKAGQGRTWSDTAILQNAGLPVVTTNKYENLFYMLEGERFDYFPRGVHEPWSEVIDYAELDLTVEDKLLLIYPLPAYLFVHKNNIQLADKIEAGLLQAIEDGSFDDYFYNNPMIKAVLDKANLAERTVFRIKNPNLPADTPFNDDRLWYKLK